VTPAVSYRARRAPVKSEDQQEHEYSSLQVQITGKPADVMRKMQAKIAKADLQPDKDREAEADDGLEHDFHITARWGLHFMTPSAKLRQALKSFGPITVEFGKSSLFTGGDADVLKVDVKSAGLHKLYALIGRMVPVHTTFPVYRPHATLGYLKKGKGAKYVGDDSLSGTKMTFTSVEFSGKKGHKEILPLGYPAPGPYRVR
jgi:2'-5' RNA ligase superfamily